MKLNGDLSFLCDRLQTVDCDPTGHRQIDILKVATQAARRPLLRAGQAQHGVQKFLQARHVIERLFQANAVFLRGARPAATATGESISRIATGVFNSCAALARNSRCCVND